jgi:hypothetical protein
MREVRVPTGFAAQSCRHAIVALATWLIVLQAFLAGVAAAQAAATPASAAGDAICHGSSANADGPGGTAPENGKVAHLCCVACTSAAPALAAPEAPKPLRRLAPASRPASFASFIVVIEPGAIRAGLSQAPPSLA